MAQYPRVILVILCSYTLPLLSLKESVETIRKFSKKELLGQINPASHSAFSEIPSHLCNRHGLYLRTEVLEAFLDLEKNEFFPRLYKVNNKFSLIIKSNVLYLLR